MQKEYLLSPNLGKFLFFHSKIKNLSRTKLESGLCIRVSALAKSLDVAPATLAVRWVGEHPAVTAPIIGARNLEQLEESLKAVEIEMTKDLYDSISAITQKPAIATDRTEEIDEIMYRS